MLLLKKDFTEFAKDLSIRVKTEEESKTCQGGGAVFDVGKNVNKSRKTFSPSAKTYNSQLSLTCVWSEKSMDFDGNEVTNYEADYKYGQNEAKKTCHL